MFYSSLLDAACKLGSDLINMPSHEHRMALDFFKFSRQISSYHSHQDRIDYFFSHDWDTSRMLKWLSLLVMFNAPAAALVMLSAT